MIKSGYLVVGVDLANPISDSKSFCACNNGSEINDVDREDAGRGRECGVRNRRAFSVSR